jgi:formate dehydrogenase
MTSRKHTFCRICEPACPLVAELDDGGKVVRLVPDAGHPCGGIACHKGLSYLDVHRDPDRIGWPLKRRNERTQARGEFERVDWDAALGDIGARLQQLQEKHGRDAVAFYLGNPGAFNSTGLLLSTPFQDSMGTRMRFCSSTLDTTNKFSAAAAIYGSYGSFMIPDFYNTDYLLVLGSNPKVSRWTILSAPNNMDMVKQIRERGGKVRFVNPRQTESSTAETGPTLRIKPGTDVYFLAAVLHEIGHRRGFDEAMLERWGRNVDRLRAFVERYPPERVSPVTGLEVAAIREVAAELMAARSAAVYMATGVNQSRQGVLCSWLVEMVNFVTGNLGREGGTHRSNGLFNHCPPAGKMQQVATSLGTLEVPDPFGYLALPATLLPDLIENGDIRALIVFAGNPLLSAGGEERLRGAFEKLELMVSLDIYRSATAEMSDYVLPTTDWLERADVNILGDGMQPVPYVQYTDAVEAPAGERRSEWWILSRLQQFMGLPSALDANPDQREGLDILQGVLGVRGLTIEAMRQAPHQTVTFPQEPRNTVFERCLQHPDKKVDCCPPAFDQAGLLERCESMFADFANEPADVLRLVTLRTTHMHNSWLSNSARFRHGRQALNPLHMCEADAAARGLHDGDAVRVSTRYGEVETRLVIDDDLRAGAVAMSHGYGHHAAFGLSVATRKPGANYNRLMPSGPGISEPLSHMSWLSAVPVQVNRIELARAEPPG